MKPTFQPRDRFATPLPSVETAGAVATEIDRLDIPDGGAAVIRAEFTARRTDGTFGVATFERRYVAENNGGTVTVRADEAPSTDYNPNSYGGPSISTDSAGVILSVTGKASTPLQWRVLATATL